ncbi:glycosyltransferase [Acinetobacter baumannii]|nr:glycosyltransferase [Acinetobacter baumannii]
MNKVNPPLVSIVIPCYNHENFVQDCIQSVLDQTYENIELIIIDDGSKDDSVLKIKQMLEKCEKRFFRFEFRYRPNKGLSATLNEALEWCQGEYLAPFASDDIMCNFRIEKQVEHFSKITNDNVDGVFGGYYLIDNSNKILTQVVGEYREFNNTQIIMHQFELPAPTALLRLCKVKDVGGYDPNIKIEDWYMWLKLTEKGKKLIYIPEVLCYYRSHPTNSSKNLQFMYDESFKLLNLFKDNKDYLRAVKNIEWHKVTDDLNVNTVLAISGACRIVRNYPTEIFSRNILRFIYYCFKGLKKWFFS